MKTHPSWHAVQPEPNIEPNMEPNIEAKMEPTIQAANWSA